MTRASAGEKQPESPQPGRYARSGTRRRGGRSWLAVNKRGPLTANGIYQTIGRRGRQHGAKVFPDRFRHHFSHTWLDRGGAEGDLMELNSWTSPQMLRPYAASARSTRRESCAARN